jgi:ATP-dependent exoDNAse (exonuclease V) alpha subunit
VERHCTRTGQTKIVVKAEETIDGRPLTYQEKVASITGTKGGNEGNTKTTSSSDKTNLQEEVELAIGMEIMVLANVNTELDIANGARGRITRIVMHEDEHTVIEGRSVELTRMPAYLVVELNRTKVPQLPGLNLREIPIEPIERTYRITMQDGTTKTVSRLQFPITAAYAFTDYRSQGQTIPYVIVDIGKPPFGKLTPFNAYVALSRAKGRHGIRLLRDFDRQLFQTVPCHKLAMEDERLLQQDKLTKERLLANIEMNM